MAGRRVGPDIFLHEQNAVPGLANRVVARRARRSFVAFPAAAERLPRAEVVGNPLRPEIVAFDRAALRGEALRRYDLPDDVTVLGVLGGSLGPKVLNDMTLRIADGSDPERVAILHLTGAAHLESVAAHARRSAVRWRTVAYEPEMRYFYAAADLVLSRAGAMTISELAATGTPAVTVPLVEHQAANAAHLAGAGGVVIVPEDDLDRVPVEVEQLLVDDARRRRMADANLLLAAPDAATRIAAAIRDAARD
jgi:UDP-N-acetylglucosamine--N-acetylmuramyl-(pentapeptide) pyrophosphoryl-undecaprenol N-acetylglucosamine transferase